MLMEHGGAVLWKPMDGKKQLLQTINSLFFSLEIELAIGHPSMTL